MKLAWILWLANVLPAQPADQLCLATTLYLEARNQSTEGQLAVAEVALRRRDNGRWGNTLCQVLLQPHQFAMTLVHPGHVLRNETAWNESWNSASLAIANWEKPIDQRKIIVPYADHFFAHNIANPYWAELHKPLATIGDHSFYRLD